MELTQRIQKTLSISVYLCKSVWSK